MKFWIFLILGIGCVIATRIIIHYHQIGKISDLKPGKQLIAITFAILAINLVGGIIVGDFCHMVCISDSEGVWRFLGIILTIAGAGITYTLGHLILGLDYFDKKVFQVYFVLVFIVSILLWTSEITKYRDNIVTNTETVVVAESERELIQFEGIFVQKESNQNDTDSKKTDVENTKKDLTGDDKVSYWYINKKGEGQYNSVSAKSCKIKLISNNESPYVKTIKKCKQTTTTNNNNGKESTEKEKEFK